MRTPLILFTAFALLTGCAAEATSSLRGSPDGRGVGDSAEGGTMGSPGSGSGSSGVEAGTLTAGVWDDNRNFDHFNAFRSEAAEFGRAPFTDAEHSEANARFSDARPARELLDVALLVDTTGSMADEIRYLQAEFQALSSQLAAAHPNAEQRWALVVYRDETDLYVTRSFDFSRPEEFERQLREQSADGGGDFPEAAHAGLADMNDLSWREGSNVARLVFWVADAPHHQSAAEAVAVEVREAAQSDIHIYPVASSGVDELAERTMRESAQLTGGRYIFLTDDSGVGDTHREPSIPCYFVTKLNDAIARMVEIELSGEYREPAADAIIRTGGDPSDGACMLEDGKTVRIF